MSEILVVLTDKNGIEIDCDVDFDIGCEEQENGYPGYFYINFIRDAITNQFYEPEYFEGGIKQIEKDVLQQLQIKIQEHLEW